MYGLTMKVCRGRLVSAAVCRASVSVARVEWNLVSTELSSVVK